VENRRAAAQDLGTEEAGMTGRRKWIAWLLTLAVCLGVLAPVRASAADLYFTSINDNLLPLTADTMPLWNSGGLYVPYTVFDKDSTGVDLGLFSSYNRTENKVTVFNLRQILVFALNSDTCRDDLTGEMYNARVIVRNGRPYLPVRTVCSFFNGLSYTCSVISQGYLVRIKNESVVLTDAKFIDAAQDLINRRLREYNQSLNPTPATTPTPEPVTPATPATEPEETEEPTDVQTYLAFRCPSGDSVAAIADTLDRAGVSGLFFLAPSVLEDGSLVRRLLGTGHSVGILAEGEDLSQTQGQLAQGNRLLEQLTYTRTTLAYAPQDQRSGLEAEGWVCWNETLALSPTATVGVNTFAANTLRRLEGRTRSTYLTMDGTEHTQRVLATLLRQLSSQHFVVSIPVETKL
jgi:hypothetical protein